MAELDKDATVSLKELMVSTLAMADAVTKLLIEKGVITEAEFKEKLFQERAVYQKLLNPTIQWDFVTGKNSMGDRQLRALLRLPVMLVFLLVILIVIFWGR